MAERKHKNKYARKYEEYYTDVVDYSIEVNQKFASHNTFMFFIYGVGLNIIEIEFQALVCGLCFTMSAISLITFFSNEISFFKV